MSRDYKRSNGESPQSREQRSQATPGKSTLTEPREQRSQATLGKSTLTEFGGGEPLPKDVRSQFERSVGEDLSGVRVHHGSAAGDAARSIGARAYAIGQNIAFAPGQYDPRSPKGNQLLAHEVAHTVQQREAIPRLDLKKTRPGDTAETNADDAAAAMVKSEPVHVTPQPEAVALKPENEDPLKAIQGYAMYALLPALAALPVGIRTDEEAGSFVGGPRLLTAMRVVAARGTPWHDFVAAHGQEIDALPSDQIGDIMKFLGAPMSARHFSHMWEAHPHKNTSSEDVLEQHGRPDSFENTCAIRLSIMLNNIGLTITPQKTKAAGITRKPHYSKNTKQHYILSAQEMWTYFENYFRAADRIFPALGKYKNDKEFQKEFDSTIKPIVRERKGIVAFEKIFSFSGTGHVDPKADAILIRLRPVLPRGEWPHTAARLQASGQRARVRASRGSHTARACPTIAQGA